MRAHQMDHLVTLRRAMDYMDEHFAELLTVEDVAAHSGYSLYHFLRSFRKVYGETPAAYLARRRIERAKHLLREPCQVTDVAFAVGFASLGSFSATFRKMTGMSPREFRAAAAMEANQSPAPACFMQRWSRPITGRNTAILEK